MLDADATHPFWYRIMPSSSTEATPLVVDAATLASRSRRGFLCSHCSRPTVILCSSLLLVGVCVGVGVVAHRPDGPPRPASLPHPTRRPAKPSSTVLLQTEQQAAPKAQTFTIYSPEPIDLKYGQVHHYLWT